MSRRTMHAGEVLHCEFGSAIVVDPGATAAGSLVELLDASIGLADGVTAAHPVIVEASAKVRVHWWHSCTKSWRIGNGVDEDHDNYWAEDGDGRRQIMVAHYPDSLNLLTDAISARGVRGE